jgi:ferredoxin
MTFEGGLLHPSKRARGAGWGSRLGLLRSLFAPPPLRPPGAKKEAEFSALCTRCDRCIQVCPYGTLQVAGFAYGAAVGTPVMMPDRQRRLRSFLGITGCVPETQKRHVPYSGVHDRA